MVEIEREAGANRLRYGYTLGADDFQTIHEYIRALGPATKFSIEMYCHNDLDMAETAILCPRCSR